MTDVKDANVVPEEQLNTKEQVIEVDYKAKYEEAQKSIDALAAKKDELLSETKKHQEEKRNQAAIADQAKQEQLKESEKKGEFEKLWKIAQEEKETLRQELSNSKKDRRDEKVSLAAMKIAIDLAKGNANKAELLSEFLAKSIGKVADEYGNLDSDLLSSVRTQFETDKKYTPLLGGNQSVGSGAPGNTRGAQQTAKTLSREEFDSLDQSSRTKFFKDKGKLV